MCPQALVKGQAGAETHDLDLLLVVQPLNFTSVACRLPHKKRNVEQRKFIYFGLKFNSEGSRFGAFLRKIICPVVTYSFCYIQIQSSLYH